ncbi:MAG: hypothetical protein ACO3FK_06970 [Vulcanococcus sp.]|jgi:hypothetical protein
MDADLSSNGQPLHTTPRESASSTSLKWGQNGELSPVDLQRVLERLTDPALIQCNLHADAGGE